MWLPAKLGTISTGTRRGWIFCCWRHTPTLRQHPTWCRRTSMVCSLDAQRVTLGSWVGVNSSISGAPGSAASAAEGSWRSSLNRASTRGLPGGDPGQPGDQQELGRFVDGWTARRLAHCSWARNASTAVTPPGASTGRAAWDYVVPASPGGSVVGIFLLSAP